MCGFYASCYPFKGFSLAKYPGVSSSSFLQYIACDSFEISLFAHFWFGGLGFFFFFDKINN